MHISEGVLSAPVLASGAVLTAAGVGYGLKKTHVEKIPEVAVLTAAFFVASLIHVPIGPSNAHLVLNGLLGIFLGWSAFPAVLIALFLQALLFQFGGLTSLGVNTFTMAFPALCSYWIFHIFPRKRSIGAIAFGCGAGSVLLSGLLVAIALASTGKSFLLVSKVFFISHIPVSIMEGFITAVAVLFIRKISPELLD